MTSTAQPAASNDVMRGIVLSALGYACFSVQDATVKWLVTSYSVPQILFVRSLVIIAIAAAVGGPGTARSLWQSRNKGALVVRAALILAAWLSFYSAAPHLGLAELTTLYFAAPIIAVTLSIPVLGETVDRARWLAVLGGFAGVVMAASPSGNAGWLPAGLALFAACCWGLSVVLVRLINRSESTANQMVVSNGLFALACAPMLFWSWQTPNLFSLGLMLGLGVAGGLGQFLLYEGFRYAPASVVAPIEYTGLVWAFLYGYLIWSDIPRPGVFGGAGLIVLCSLFLVFHERRRQAAPEARGSESR